MSTPAPVPLRLSATPAPSAVLELLKPITWFAPMWAYLCGAVSSGQPFSAHVPELILGVVLCGPLVCATSQAVNDWFDREVDAINEPHRPIPSGRIPGTWGLRIAIAMTALSLAVGAVLGPIVFGATVLGLLLAWGYSAPPFRFKKDGWLGNAAVGLSYETLPWFTAAALMTGGLPDWRGVVIALLYGIGAHGIMTLNDFKSVEGDKRMGVRSLPVQLGVDRAARLACLVMGGVQVIVIGLLASFGELIPAVLVAGLLLMQVALMAHFVAKPFERAIWYNGTGTTLYVLGMLVSALALSDLAKAGL